MLRSELLVFFLLCGQGSVWSVRLVELRVPAHEREGGKALLGCQYDMEGEVLYSVKWYKDELEFFRYVPKSNPRMISFKRPGVHVDMMRSSSTVVALNNLTREAEGTYSCEVSGESPSFNTARSHKKIEIYLLPESGPYVTGVQESYTFDETVLVNCSSSGSRPKTTLNWLLNGLPVPQSYLNDPWYRISAERPDAIETILQLKFIVAPEHFVDGAMWLKCEATIAPLYQRETNSKHYIRLPELISEKHGLLMGDSSNHAPVTSIHSTVISFIYVICIYVTLNILSY